MGVSLDYCTTAPVSRHVKDAICAEAERLEPSYGWWAEPLNFFDPGEGDGRLCGRTKIDLVGYSIAVGEYVEVDINDNDLMRYRDMCFILEALAAWGAKYGLSWEVEHAGEPVGMIEKGRWDTRVHGYVEEMKKFFQWPTRFEDAVKAISEKYASRW
jgi:hypothetical protein